MLQLIIKNCQQIDVQAVSDMLEESGAIAVSLTDCKDEPILEPEIGTTPLWDEVSIQALFMDKVLLDKACINLKVANPNLEYLTVDVPEKDWVRETQANFKPRYYGGMLWVCPSWESPPNPQDVNVFLNPGLAFGTGHHATTSLCLFWLAKANLQGIDVIDYGCGSGILALAALKLGAKDVVAVDIDEQALIATTNNALENSIADESLHTGKPEILTKPVDLLVANILMLPLLELCPRFAELLNPQGKLIISGLLSTQQTQVAKLYEKLFHLEETLTDDGWLLMSFTKR